MLKVDDGFDGRLVALQVGEKLEITLAENASTGYRWNVPPAVRFRWTPILRELEETAEARGTRPGMPGIRRLYFEATAAGSAELQLEYRRPWEESAEPARTFRLRVEVRSVKSG